MPSGRYMPVVFFLQPAPSIPERLRLGAACTRDQNVEMHVPAGADHQRNVAVRQTAVDHGEQHPLARRLKLKRHLAALAPGEGELMRRIDLDDPALHPVLVGETGRALAGWIG